jgi:hypothetical protein
MSEPAQEIKFDPTSVEGMDEVFELSGTEAGTAERTTGTSTTDDPGQPGQDTVDASAVLTFISTAEASKLAGVDSRTIRRWHEQKKIRGQFSKGKLLVVQEDLSTVSDESDLHTAGTAGTESGTPDEESRTPDGNDPGQPGQDADIPQSPAIVFSDVFDRIERLSRENGELKALLDEQRRENQQLKLLADSQHKRGGFARFWYWFTGR